MSSIKLKRIAVHETVYQRLKSLGSTGDSFNDVLIRILTEVQKEEKKKFD
jgi:predicted CopG family antitoxin